MTTSSQARKTQRLPDWLLDFLACPKCGGGTLVPRDGALVCATCGQHYPTSPHLDLLAPGKRPPNEGPGDTAEMVGRRVAWERRIAGGASSGEREATERYLDAIVSRLRPGATVVDLGCGTGAVLRGIAARQDGPLSLIGFDISLPMLDACYRALRYETRAAAVRASTRRRLPLRDGVADLVLRRLAPALPEEIVRVMHPGSAYITASFGPKHWRELYDALPDLPRPKGPREPTAGTPEMTGLIVVERQEVRERESIPPAAALKRLQAGPAAFHGDPARDLPRLYALAEQQGTPGQLSLSTDADITVYGKP